MRRVAASILLLAVANLLAVAKDQPFQVVSWPDSGPPVLRFTFSKFKDVAGGMGKERTYISDVQASTFQTRPSVVRVFRCMCSTKVRQESVRAISI
jgi:hypothetical protein